MSDTPFKIGMYLGELRLPLEAAMAKAAEIGAESVWYDRLPGDSPMVEMTDQEADRVAELGDGVHGALDLKNVEQSHRG